MRRRQKHENVPLVTVQPVTHQGILCHENASNFLAAYVYVLYRSSHPDQQTVQDVLKDLHDNNIDVSKLVKWRADQCEQEKLSTAGGSSTEPMGQEIKRNLLQFRTFWTTEQIIECNMMFQNCKLYLIELNIIHLFAFPHIQSQSED